MSDADKTDEIISTAFNFDKHFSTGVNARTGMYQLAIVLGKLGDAFELKVAYNSLSRRNEGFGIGWALNVSHYDRANRRLTLSDGRSYRITTSRSRPEVECQYLKLQDIKVLNHNNELTVTCKDGTIEQFDSEGYLRSVTNPSGHTVVFTYLGRRLVRITNQNNVSLTLVYDTGEVRITGAKSQDSVRVRVSNRITHVYLPDDTTYQIQYRAINGLYVVEEIKYPTGATEKLTYEQAGMRLPSDGPISHLPAVIKRDIYGTDVPRMTRSYRYSRNNFLGYGLSRYTPDVDNLFETVSDYVYSCTETFGDKEVTQTYNKYHLLIEEAHLALPSRQLMQKKIVEYYADTSKGFDVQPAQYLFPRKEAVTYYNLAGNSRTEISEFEYDSYGNELRRVDPYGIETRMDYYAATGEAEFAPAAPAGMPCLLKSQTTAPAAHKKSGGEVAHISTFRYGLHPSLQQGKYYPVIVKEMLSTVTGRQLSVSKYEYVNSPDTPYSHGKLARLVKTEGSSESCKTYTYSLLNGISLTMLVTSSFQDGLTYTEEEETCLHCGKPLSSTDRHGIQATKEYDGLGRIVKEMARVGTEFETVKTYLYSIGAQNQLNIQVSDGTQSRVIYDTLGRETAYYATNCAGQLVLMNQQSYNAQGQVITRTTYDDFGAGQVGVSTNFTYDYWGEVCEEKYASGEVKVTLRDKASNTQTEYIKGGSEQNASVTTYYDERKKIIKEAYPDFDIVITHNGFGEEVKRKNAFNVETTFERDDSGRVCREQTGNITISKTFTDDNRELVTELKCAELTVGKRQYDSLGRVTSETKGGGTTDYYYTTLSEKPSVVKQPSGEKIEYSLAVGLDKVSAITTSDDSVSFTFDSRGLLTNANSLTAQRQCIYYPNRLLKSESQSGKIASYTYSRQGKLLTLTNYMGQTEQRGYDAFHRLNQVVFGQTTVTLGYNRFGDLQTEHITSPSNPTLLHYYNYDDQRRLTEKNTLINGERYLSQKYFYIREKRLSSKTVLDAAGNATTETYHYDDNGRVDKVSWSGGERPDYLGMGAMLSQSFSFDSQGNITEVDTQFTRGNEQARDLASYTYNSGRLSGISHSLPELGSAALTYDDNGNVTLDEQRRRYIYNVRNQLIQIQDANGITLSTYTYSANDLQLTQSVPGQPPIELFYGLGQLLNESQGAVNSHLLIVGGRPISRLVNVGGVITETGLVTDHKGSVLREVRGQARIPLAYTIYGEATSRSQ